jgi:hypothetical protein
LATMSRLCRLLDLRPCLRGHVVGQKGIEPEASAAGASADDDP